MRIFWDQGLIIEYEPITLSTPTCLYTDIFGSINYGCLDIENQFRERKQIIEITQKTSDSHG